VILYETARAREARAEPSRNYIWCPRNFGFEIGFQQNQGITFKKVAGTFHSVPEHVVNVFESLFKHEVSNIGVQKEESQFLRSTIFRFPSPARVTAPG
jgi:hypothetical protein